MARGASTPINGGFRQDLGGVEDAYQEVARRLGVLPQNEKEVFQQFQPKKKPSSKVMKGSAKAKTKAKKKRCLSTNL